MATEPKNADLVSHHHSQSRDFDVNLTPKESNVTSRPHKIGGPLDSPRFPNTHTTEDTQATDSFLTAGIFEWIKDPKATAFKIGEAIAKEAKQNEVDTKDFIRSLKMIEDLTPFKAILGYLEDSVKARMKAVEKLGPAKKKSEIGSPTQAEVDAQRTFKASSVMGEKGEDKRIYQEALDSFVRKTGFKDKEKSTESKKEWEQNRKKDESFENYFKRIGKTPWYSLDLNKKITENGIEKYKYTDQLDKSTPLYSMSKLVGKFNFQVNPNLLPDEDGNLTQSQIKYKDAYDFAATKADTHLTSLSKFFHLGPSKGPPDEWNISRTIPLEQMPATVTTEIPKITKI